MFINQGNLTRIKWLGKGPKWAVTGIALWALSGSASALNTERQISQYGHTSWRLQDGVFEGVPHAMTQTADGYLWVGTEAGLLRFDGVRFVPWAAPTGTALSSVSVYSLLGARDGTLWIGTSAGLSHWDGLKLVNYSQTSGRISAIIEDSNGTVWTVRSRPRNAEGPLCAVTRGKVRCFGPSEGLSFPWAEALIDDRRGGLWIGSTNGLWHWTRDASHHYFSDRLRRAEGSTGIEALALTGDGLLLVGVGQAGLGLGLQQIRNERVSSYLVPGIDGSSLAVGSLLVDRDSGVWIGTASAGIYHVRSGKTDRFGEADGLSSDTTEGFYQDREGNIWAISPRGIDQFRDVAISNFSKREGLMADSVGSVLAAKDGTIWIGNGRSLVSLRHGILSARQIADRLPGKSITALMEDHAGRLWVGIDTGLAVLEGHHFRTILDAESKMLRMVTGIVEDIDRNVWVIVMGRPQKLLRIRGLVVDEVIQLGDSVLGSALAADPAGGIWLGHVSGDLTKHKPGTADFTVPADGSGALRSVKVASDGSVWATSEKGLVRWKEGVRHRLDGKQGLPCNNIYSLVVDNDDSLWLYASCGITMISAKEAEKWWANPNASIRVKILDVLDGAQPGLAPFAPSASQSPDGRLWFANARFVQFVDPRHLPDNRLQPPVRIEEVIADSKVLAPEQGLRLPAKTRDVQINYTALSFVVPQKVHFRYQLEGRDRDWQDAGVRRQAYYTDLSPGNYRFRVIATNNDGLWNNQGADLRFSVAASWYQALWFRLLSSTAALIGLWSLYRLQRWQITAGWNEHFDERIAERNLLAVELHDSFLQTVQATRMVVEQSLLDGTSDSSQLRAAMEKVAKWLTQAVSDGQAVLNALRTSTAWRIDLADSFERAAAISRVNGSMEFFLSVDGMPKGLRPIVRDEVYTIGSQAIRDAHLHSGGTRLDVAITYAQDLIVRVWDNGKGFNTEVANNSEGSRLSEMQRRADRIGARLRLSKRPYSGTEIELRVPGRIAFHRGARRDTEHKH